MLSQLYKPFQHWSEKNAVWVISDTHFGDEELKAKIPNRPSDEELIKNINQKVGKNGTLILLGDVGDIECAKRLKGYKVLIKGNHDKGITNYEEIFDEVYSGNLIISDKIILSHAPIDNIPWIFNIHGHVHTKQKNKPGYLCVCADVIDYTPISLNKFVTSGELNKITSQLRTTINKATERKRKRNKSIN